MKNLYAFILFCALIQIGSAQVLTLTQAANEPIVGDAERRKGFDSTSALVNSTGSNQLWNFTTLTSNTVAAITYSYVTPSAAPGYTASFAAATVAKVTSTVNSDFYKSSSNLFELLGSRPSTSLTLTYTNSAIAAQWPITNTYSVTDAFAGTMKVVIGLSGTGPINGTQTVKATGTGTLQLPNSITLNDCMQVTSNLTGTGNVTILLIGTVNFTLVNTSVTYYHASQKFPVLTINYSTTSVLTGTPPVNTTKTAQISVNNDVFVGVNEISKSISSLNIYPNPASSMVYVNLNNINSEAVSVEILNSLGQVVKTVDLGNTKGEINTSIDVKNLPSGIYFVKTSQGAKTSVKKLIIE